MTRRLEVEVGVELRDGQPHLLSGLPGNGPRVVARVCNRWQVRTDWWRRPVERDYWRVLLTDGVLCELSHDLLSHSWTLERMFD